jgi:type I protein arginine methyltransferase
LIYGQAFFPLAEPVHLALGDTVSVAIHADLVDTDYIWRWHTTVFSQGNPNEVKASFQQSTFWGKPLSPARLRKGAGSYVPALNEEGRIEQFILSLMDGERPLEQIARQAAARFPERFSGWRDALTRVAGLSQKYSR